METENHVLLASYLLNQITAESDDATYIGSAGAGKIYPGARIKAALFSSFVQNLVDWQPDIIHSQCEFPTFLIARQIAKSLDIPEKNRILLYVDRLAKEKNPEESPRYHAKRNAESYIHRSPDLRPAGALPQG